MARLTIYATADGTTVSHFATQELAATFEAALATLVADGASPTQAHVTAVNSAYTNLKAIWTKDFVVDYDRAQITTDAKKRLAAQAALAEMLKIT